MTKSVRKAARYSLIVLGLVALALLAAPFFIDVNEYKSRIEQSVEDATGRKLHIGAIKASLFPWVGVQLDDVHLANRQGFSGADFVSVKRVHVKLDLLPLLSRKVEIKKFEISSPRLFLQRHGDNDSNWADLISVPASGGGDQNAAPSSSGQDQNGGGTPMLAALMAESISLSDGELTWVDGDKAPLILSGLDVTLKDVQLERPVSVSVSGRVNANDFSVQLNVGPLGQLGSLAAEKLPVQGQFKADNFRLQPFQQYISGWPELMGDPAQASAVISFKFEQHPDGVRLSEGDVSLKGAHELGLNWKVEMRTADQLDVRRASLTVDGKDIADVTGGVRELNSNPAFEIRLNGQPLSRAWLAGFAPGLNSLYEGNPVAWKQIKFAALITGDDSHINISDLQLMLDQELIQASGSVAFKGPDIKLDVTARSLHIDPWMPAAADLAAAPASGQSAPMTEATAGKQASGEAEPDLRFLKPWKLRAKVKANAIFLHGLEMQNFLMSVKASRGLITLRPLSFNLAGGKVVEKASINVAAYPARWRESVQMKNVAVGPLLKSQADMDMLEGTLEMNTSFKATGLTNAAISSLNGRANVVMSNGKIRGFDIAGALRRFTNPAAPVGPQETDFSKLSASFVIKNGVAANKDLFMASPLLRVTGHGTVDLVKKEMDYHVKPRVVGTLKGQGDSIPLRRGLSVPMHISGPFASPRVRFEVNAKTLIKNAPALLKKGKIGGALGKILKGGSNNKGAAAKQKHIKPADIIRKGLGGLIPGF